MRWDFCPPLFTREISNQKSRTLIKRPFPRTSVINKIFSPVWEVIDLLVPPLHLTLEVDQLPEIVRVHVLHRAGADLNLSDRDQHLIADDLDLSGVRFARGALFARRNTCVWCSYSTYEVLCNRTSDKCRKLCVRYSGTYCSIRLRTVKMKWNENVIKVAVGFLDCRMP